MSEVDLVIGELIFSALLPQSSPSIHYIHLKITVLYVVCKIQ